MELAIEVDDSHKWKSRYERYGHLSRQYNKEHPEKINSIVKAYQKRKKEKTLCHKNNESIT